MRTRTRGTLYDQAAAFDAQLLARQTAAADQMLGAWTRSYWTVRDELDTLLGKIARAREAGEAVSPAWAYQQGRLKALLDTTKTEVTRYAQQASTEAQAAQQAAIRAGQRHAERLTETALLEQGIEAGFARTDPTRLLQQAVGLMGDGNTLATHLAKTLTDETVDGIRSTVLKGLLLGKGQDWLIREVTRNYALAHTRAETIMRTETMRAYREVSRQTYEANTDVLEGWTWQAHLDGRTCVACALMDGTLHPVTDTLDGHPRCRCAMVPRTKSWEQLGVPGLEDTRPDVPSGRAWLEAQSPATQKAMMGPAKFDAWQRGDITLDDMVAQHHSDDWGTMRTERSLKSIQEGRNPNPAPTYVAEPASPVPPTRATELEPEGFRPTNDYGNLSLPAIQRTKRLYAWDGHRVHIEVDMPDEAVAEMLEEIQAVILAAKPTRPITYRVPDADRMFVNRGTGLTGGYVTKGLDVVNINPRVARGDLESLDDAQREAQFMDAAKAASLRHYIIAHETGHVVDHQAGHVEDPFWNKTNPAEAAFFRKWKSKLSRYGRTNSTEGYAEAYAQWINGGPGSSEVADAYADRYGWKR